MLLLLIAIIYFVKNSLFLALPTRNLLKIYIYIYIPHRLDMTIDYSYTKPHIIPNGKLYK